MRKFVSLPIGTTRIWKIKKPRRCYYRRFIKVNHPKVWMRYSIFVWIANGQCLEKGYCLHHKDRNFLNDEFSNLSKLKNGEHAKLHRQKFGSCKICGAKLFAKGFCVKHYEKLGRRKIICKECNKKKFNHAKGLCKNCYNRSFRRKKKQ